MIEIDDVSVDIGRRRIVDHVSLSVPDGQVTGLLGPNGSGKSTLLATLFRGRRPATGSIRLDGVDLATLSRREVARRVAVLTQDVGVEFDATVAEIVMIGRTPHQRGLGRESRTDRDAVMASLERVGCADLAHRSVHSLSGGERQRVFIARALAQGCDHLVLDEPTNHLDIRFQLEVLDIVTRLGVSVLAALHDLSLAGLYCDTVHLMAAGRVIAAGPPADVITSGTVADAYGADVLVLPHPEAATPWVLARRSTPPTPTKGTP